MRSGRRIAFAGLCALAIAAVAAPSSQAAATRAEYSSQVNTICTASGGELEDSISEIGQARKPKALFRLMERLTKDLRQMVDGIAAVAPAPGDETAVAEWIASLRETVTEMDSVTDLSKKFIRMLKRKPTRKAILRLAKQLGNASKDLVRATDDATARGNLLGATECV